MAKRIRIEWTERERRAVVEAIAEGRMKSPSMAMGPLVMEAQNRALPPERRRKYLNTQVATLLPDVEALLKDWYRKARKPEQPPPPEPEPLPTVEDVIKDAPTQILTLELVRRLFIESDSVVDRLEAVERAVDRLSVSATGSTKSLRAKVPRVLVVGLKGDQANTIRNALEGEDIDLRLVVQERKRPTKYPEADIVFLTGFNSHSDIQKVMSQFGKHRIRRAGGAERGTSILIGELRKIAREGLVL